MKQETKPNHKPLQSRIPEDLIDELKIVAIREHVSLEQQVAIALRDFVERYKAAKRQQVGAGGQ
jgi:hypothetical protein